MYQPKIRDDLIRKLYFRARREQKKMTCFLNDLLEEVLTGEPEPPPYSETEPRDGDPVKRKMRLYEKIVREYREGGAS